MMVVYHNAHPPTLRWIYEQSSNCLIHFDGGYHIPLSIGNLDYWRRHIADKSWATDADLLELEIAFNAITGKAE